jgi:hypothetical protein
MDGVISPVNALPQGTLGFGSDPTPLGMALSPSP